MEDICTSINVDGAPKPLLAAFAVCLLGAVHIEMAHASTARPDVASTSVFARKKGFQRRRPASSTPRVGMRCLAVAAASLFLAFLPTSGAAGAGLSSAATVNSRKRATGAAAGRKKSGIDGSAQQQPRDGRDHDPRARRRRYSRPGEGDSGYAGSSSAGSRNRRDSNNSQDKISTSSSFRVMDSEEDDEGSSWDGTGSASDGSENRQEDLFGDSGSSSGSSSCENYDTEEGLCEEETEDREEGGLTGAALGGDGSSSEEDQLSDSEEEDLRSDLNGEGKDELSPHHHQGRQQNSREQPGHQGGHGDNSVEVCVVTWNLAEESPPARDLEFLRQASRGSDLVAVGVQEIENLKPRRNEGGRTREWRRLLIRWVGAGGTPTD